MTATRTFARRMGAAFAASLLLTAFIGLVAVLAMHSIARRVDQLEDQAVGPLMAGEQLRTEALRAQASHARFLVSNDPLFLTERDQAHLQFSDVVRRVRPQLADDQSRQLLDQIERAEAEQNTAFDQAVNGPTNSARVLGLGRALDSALDTFVAHERERATNVRRVASEDADRSRRLIDLVTPAVMLLAAGVALLLARRFIREYERAQQAIRAREQFLTVASQELARPLSSLAHQLEPLRRAAHEQPQGMLQPDLMDRRIDQARTQLTRMTTMVNEMLDASRLQAGQVRLTREPVDLAQTVRAVARRLERTPLAAGTALDVHAQARVVGLWDRARLEQIIEELLTNALKHAHGKVVRVNVEGGEPARLVVRDHGTGIAREQQSHLFEPFEAATYLHEEGGLGLGLYIVRQLVQAHGGQIRMESTPKVGTTIVAELPRRPPLAPQRRWPRSPWPQPSAAEGPQ